METQYENDGFRRYRILELVYEPEDHFVYQMLSKARATELLDTDSERRDEQVKVYYDISGMLTLDAKVNKGYLKVAELKTLYKAVLGITGDAEEYLLNPDGIMLNPECIYFVPGTGGYRFFYHPKERIPIRRQLQELTEYIMKYTEHRDDAAVFLIYGLYQRLREEQDIEELLRYMREQCEGTNPESQTDAVPLAANYGQWQDMRQIPEEPYQVTLVEDAEEVSDGRKSGKKLLWDYGVILGMGITGILLLISLLRYIGFTHYESDLKGAVIYLVILVVLGYVRYKRRRAEALLKQAGIVRRQRADPESEHGGSDRKIEDEQGRNKNWQQDMQQVLPRVSEVQLVSLREEEPIQEKREVGLPKETYEEETNILVQEVQAMEAQWCLVPEAGQGATLVLHTFPGVIGRQRDVVDYLLTDSNISRKHALLFQGEDGIYVEDLNSKNGTGVNHIPLEPACPCLLREGDILTVGGIEFRMTRPGQQTEIA